VTPLGTEVEKLQLVLEAKSASYLRDLNKADRATRDLGSSMGGVDKKLQETQKKMEQWGKRALAGVAVGYAASAVMAVKASVSYESAFAGVRKTVNATEEEFASLSKEIRQMAREMPATAEEIAGVAEAAGQLGVATQDIRGFTEVMVKLGVATNMTGDEAATQLARMANITQMSADDYERLGSTIVALGNSMATTEAEIVGMTMRIAGAGHQVGMSEQQMLAWAGTLSSVGVEAELGGSAISRMFLELNTAVKGQTAELETWAQVAGMSIGDFRSMARTDFNQAAKLVIEGFAQMNEEGQDLAPTMETLKLDGIRMKDVFGRLAGGGVDVLTSSLSLANEAWAEGTALQVEAEQRFGTTESKIKIMRNNLHDLAISLGDVFAPGVSAAAEGLTSLFAGLSDLPTPLLTGGFGLIGFSIAALGLITSLAALQRSLIVTRTLIVSMNTAVAGSSLAALVARMSPILAAAAAIPAGTYQITKALGVPEQYRPSVPGMSKPAEPEMLAHQKSLNKVHEEAVGINERLAGSIQGQQQALEAAIATAEEAAKAEEELARHRKAMTATLEGLLNPQQAWTEALGKAQEAAGKHAEALGLDATATQEYVNKAEASLSDFMDFLQEQKDAQDNLIWNMRETVKRLIEAGFDEETTRRIMEQVGQLPADIVDKFANASPEEFARMADLMNAAGERSSEAWDEGVAADLDRRMEAAAKNTVDTFEDAADKKMAAAGSSNADRWATAFKTAADAALGKWNPSLGPMGAWKARGTTAGSGFGADLLAELQQMGGATGGAKGLTPQMSKLAGMVSGRFGVSLGSGFRPGATIRNTGKPSLHGMGRGGDFFGSSSALWNAFNYLALNAPFFGIQELLYKNKAWSVGVPYIHSNTNAQSVRDHQDHLHLGTRYHTGGEVSAVLQVGERVLTAEQNSFLSNLSTSLRDLIDVIRANVNADKDIPVGGKGAAANEQILDLFGTQSARLGSYATREGARLEMLKALGYDLDLQMATLERQADFLDKAVAEKAAQLQIAKDRGMDPQVINEIATELFDLSREAHDARDAMEDLARVPLEQAAAGWASSLSRVESLMDILGNSSAASSLQSGLFPDLMGAMGGGYQSALDLMNSSTDPAEISQYAGQAISGLTGMFGAEKSQLERSLSDVRGTIDAAQTEWEAAWQDRGDALDREIAREESSRQSALMQLQRDQRTELEALQANYTERLALLDASYTERLALLDARDQTVSRGRATGDLQGELDELISQEGKTEADIRRIHEIREQLSRLREDYATQDARAGLLAEQERARAGLLAEQERALSELQKRQESQRIARDDQLQAQEESARLRREAHEQERIAHLAQFAALREQAQAAYQLEIDALVVKFQRMMEEVIAQENLLLGEAGMFSNAGQTLGLSFAHGIQSAQANVAAAAAALAATAASYLELNSPAKMGPLSELDQWFVPFVDTLIEPLQPQTMALPASQVAGSMGTTTTRHLIIEGRGTLDESMLPIIVQAVKDNLRDEYDDVQWSYGR
jgi:TP901 family phage tail tape measure protein